MKAFRSPIFVICVIAVALHQLLQKGLHVSLPFVDSYLDNLLAMPVILTFLLVEKQTIFKKGNDYRLTALEVVMATIYVILITELLFPRLTDRFTADWMDVIFYSIGSLIFYFTINKNTKDIFRKDAFAS